MHASLIFLVTSLAASVVAAPVSIESPIESPEPLMVREVEENAIIPSVENLKRQILERLDAIVQRSVPDDDELPSDANEKRRNYKRGSNREWAGSSLNYKSDAEPLDTNEKRTSMRPYQGGGAGKFDKRTSTRGHQYSKPNSNYKRARGRKTSSSTNYRRDRGLRTSSSATYRRDSDEEDVASDFDKESSIISRLDRGRKTSSSTNYRRDRGLRTSSSATYRRDSDEEDVASDFDKESSIISRLDRGLKTSSPSYRRDRGLRTPSSSYRRDAGEEYVASDADEE